MSNNLNLTVFLCLKGCINEVEKLFFKVREHVEQNYKCHKCAFVIQDVLKTHSGVWREFLDYTEEEFTIVTNGESHFESICRKHCWNCYKQDSSDSWYKRVADEIHNIADNLPTYGATVNVYLWPLKDNKGDSEGDGYIHYLGALRRLKDWHNAKFTMIESNPTADTEFLQRFLSSAVHLDVTQVLLEEEVCFWRGKVSICNKIENSGLTIPGVCMFTSRNDSSPLYYPVITDTTNRKTQTLQEGQVGRMMEILDEVSLSSISAMMKTQLSYKICLYQKHPYSQVFLNYITENNNTGLLARIPIYPGDMEPVTCHETNLSTTVWKENIMTDLQFVQEPEEDLQDNYEFVYFVITSPDKYSSIGEDHIAVAYQLQHPYHLNGSLLTTVYHKALLPDRDDNGVDIDLNGLPVMSCDIFREVEMDLVILRREMLQCWINERQARGESMMVPVEELLAKFRNLQMIYLNKLTEKLPQYKRREVKLKIDLQKKVTEISEKAYDWPERLIQQYKESQKRSLSRIHSSESVAMSSPIQPSETSTTVDIQSFLKFFHPDGSASNDSLSPVRRRHPSRAKSKMVKPDTNSPNVMSWPESKDTLTHDIYYNVDKKSEKVNNHMNKIQERFIKDETYSSCLSPIVLFPKCDKKKTGTRNQQPEVRRSPRKKSLRNFHDENIPVTLADTKSQRRFARLSDTFTPLATVPEKSKRRFSTSQAPPTLGHMIQNSQQELVKRRKSEIVTRSSEVESVPSQVEKVHSKSKITPEGDGVKKESRSERHKRRLQEIVENVLIKNGVERSDKIFKSCSARLFKVTKLFVMDLPNSRNLKDEMKKIAESQVQHVIAVDKSRQKSQ